MSVEADGNGDGLLNGFDPCGDILRQQISGGVGDINVVCTIAFHQFRLLRNFFGRRHMRHHQKAHRKHIQLLGSPDMLGADIGLCHMGGYPDSADAQAADGLQVVHGSDAREQQYIQLGVFYTVGCGSDQIQFAVFAKTVVIAGTGNAVAVGNFDHENTAFVQLRGHSPDLIGGITVGYGVGAVTQGGIDNVNLLFHSLLYLL